MQLILNNVGKSGIKNRLIFNNAVCQMHVEIPHARIQLLVKEAVWATRRDQNYMPFTVE